MTVTAKVIAHSRTPGSPDLITLQVRFPWWLLPEMNTHRVFSRNYGSTRAIPITKLIEEAIHDPALPEVWTSHQPGMQGGSDLTHTQVACAEEQFFKARDAAVSAVRVMKDLNIAKQNANRLLMPFIHVEGIVTATERQNFFDLRCHPDADPTMRALAEAMRDAIEASEPKRLFAGEWHLPYISDLELRKVFAGTLSRADLPMISAARCARVSYLRHDGQQPSVEDDLTLAERLLASKHMSPFEHQARVTGDDGTALWGNFTGWDQFRKMIEAQP